MTDNLPAERRPQLTGGGAVVALVPQTLDEAYRLADALSRSGLTPYNIKTPEAVMACLIAGAELGFPPFQSLQSFAVINGRPSIYGAAVPALLWSRGFDIEEVFEGEDPAYPDTMKAICTVTRPGGKTITRTFSVADAKTGKLWGKKGANGQDTPWITSPKRMLQMRARGFAAQDGASDIMRGLPLYEEAQDYTPVQEVDVKAGTGMVERLTARAVDVDAPGFNVRSITEATTASLDAILDGDDIPAEPDKPKRPRRTKAEMEAARAAEAKPLTEAEAIARETQRGGEIPLSPCEKCGAPANTECAADCPSWDDFDPNGWPEFVKAARVRPTISGDHADSPDVAQSQHGEPATPASEPSTATDDGSPDITDDTGHEEPDEGLTAAINADEGAYALALRDAKVMKDVQTALQLIRQSETWVNLTPDEQRAHGRSAWARLNELDAPTIEQSLWQFSNWLSAGAPGGEIEAHYAALKASELYKRATAGQVEALAAAVEGALG